MSDWLLSLLAGPLVSPLPSILHPSPPSLYFSTSVNISPPFLSQLPPIFFLLYSPLSPASLLLFACCQIPLSPLCFHQSTSLSLSQEAHMSPSSWQGNEAMLNPTTPRSYSRKGRGQVGSLTRARLSRTLQLLSKLKNPSKKKKDRFEEIKGEKKELCSRFLWSCSLPCSADF